MYFVSSYIQLAYPRPGFVPLLFPSSSDLLQLKAQATQVAQMSAATVKSALDAGLAAWSSYDKDGVSLNGSFRGCSTL
jgi:hypothetical protein